MPPLTEPVWLAHQPAEGGGSASLALTVTNPTPETVTVTPGAGASVAGTNPYTVTLASGSGALGVAVAEPITETVVPLTSGWTAGAGGGFALRTDSGVQNLYALGAVGPGNIHSRAHGAGGAYCWVEVEGWTDSATNWSGIHLRHDVPAHAYDQGGYEVLVANDGSGVFCLEGTSHDFASAIPGFDWHATAATRKRLGLWIETLGGRPGPYLHFYDVALDRRSATFLATAKHPPRPDATDTPADLIVLAAYEASALHVSGLLVASRRPTWVPGPS